MSSTRLSFFASNASKEEELIPLPLSLANLLALSLPIGRLPASSCGSTSTATSDGSRKIMQWVPLCQKLNKIFFPLSKSYAYNSHYFIKTVTEILNLNIDENVKRIMLVILHIFFFWICDICCRYNILSGTTFEYHGFHKTRFRRCISSL